MGLCVSVLSGRSVRRRTNLAGISELEGRDEEGSETVVMGDEINVRMGSEWSNMRNVLQNGNGRRLWYWM